MPPRPLIPLSLLPLFVRQSYPPVCVAPGSGCILPPQISARALFLPFFALFPALPKREAVQFRSAAPIFLPFFVSKSPLPAKKIRPLFPLKIVHLHF